jgi:prolyl-tRNA editing enzyme YbaK/EbsC (Cys-tRNA(Pro) deacylase)
VKTYMDKAFQEIADIDFNAGLRTDSIKMTRADYEKAECPIIEEFTSSS